MSVSLGVFPGIGDPKLSRRRYTLVGGGVFMLVGWSIGSYKKYQPLASGN